jgi:hypothetical protein
MRSLRGKDYLHYACNLIIKQHVVGNQFVEKFRKVKIPRHLKYDQL